MTKSTPNVKSALAVVIPCFNQEATIEACLESVLSQSIPPEVIVVDDGSTDLTPAKLEKYAKRVHIIRQSNSGVSAARNEGFRASTASLVCFLDGDDLLAPGFVEAILAEAAGNPDNDVYVSDWHVLAPNGELMGPFSPPVDNEDPFHSWMRHGWGPPMCFVVRRAALEAAGLFDPELSANEEWDLWLRMAFNGVRYHACHSAVATYRLTPGSSSTQLARLWITRKTVLTNAKRLHAGCMECRRAASANSLNFVEFVIMPRLPEIDLASLAGGCVAAPSLGVALARTWARLLLSKVRISVGAIKRRALGR